MVAPVVTAKAVRAIHQRRTMMSRYRLSSIELLSRTGERATHAPYDPSHTHLRPNRLDAVLAGRIAGRIENYRLVMVVPGIGGMPVPVGGGTVLDGTGDYLRRAAIQIDRRPPNGGLAAGGQRLS